MRHIDAGLLSAMMNLSAFHRQHEMFYASAPREQALVIQRHARTLLALADRWSTVEASPRPALSPFEGAEDLNSPVATQLDGVLFMEGEGEPVELVRMVRDLRTNAADDAETGEWLRAAMAASWDAAAGLLESDDLADVLGERHRIIANDWLAADMSVLAARLLGRAADVIESVDLSPPSLRGDLGQHRVGADRLRTAAELLLHAADVLSDSAGLLNDNERRWRTFRSRISGLVARPSGEAIGDVERSASS